MKIKYRSHETLLEFFFFHDRVIVLSSSKSRKIFTSNPTLISAKEMVGFDSSSSSEEKAFCYTSSTGLLPFSHRNDFSMLFSSFSSNHTEVDGRVGFHLLFIFFSYLYKHFFQLLPATCCQLALSKILRKGV